MELSFSSCLNTWLFGLIAISLLRVLLSDVREISARRLGFFSIVMAVILIRLLFPVEFLYLQSDIYIARVWTDIYKMVTQNTFVFLGIRWNLVSVGELLSLLGSIILAVRFLYSCLRLRHNIYVRKRLPCTGQNLSMVSDYCEKMAVDGVTINGALQKIFKGKKGKADKKEVPSFSLLIDKDVESPFVFGVFQPVIVLPAVNLSEEEWYYVLRHEIAHIEHHDLFMRLGCEVLQLLYWWNPFVFRLRSLLQRVQEFRADAIACEQLNEFQRLEYMACLLKMAERQSVFRNRWIAAFQQEAELPARIRVLLQQDDDKGKRKSASGNFLAMAGIILFGILLPNFMVIKPYYSLPAEVEQIAEDSNLSGGYYVVWENDTYNIHIDGDFFRVNKDHHVTYKPSLSYRLKQFLPKDF